MLYAGRDEEWAGHFSKNALNKHKIEMSSPRNVETDGQKARPFWYESSLDTMGDTLALNWIRYFMAR